MANVIAEPESLKYSTPDDVAECLSGVCGVAGLYARLWELSNDHQPPASETPEPFRARWWSSLSVDHQAALVLLLADDFCTDCGQPGESHDFYYVSAGPRQGQYCCECQEYCDSSEG